MKDSKHTLDTIHARLCSMLGTTVPRIPEGVDVDMVTKVLDTLTIINYEANIAESMGLSDLAASLDGEAMVGITMLVRYFKDVEQDNMTKDVSNRPPFGGMVN